MKPKLPRIWLDKSSIDRRGGVLEGRIIAGRCVEYSEKKYPEETLGDLGAFGSRGTLEFRILLGDKAGMQSDYIKHKAVGLNSPKEIIDRLDRLSGPIMSIIREVPPEHQRSGIGTAMLRESEKIAVERGVGLIYATTMNPNAEKSYKRLGWELIWETYELVNMQKQRVVCYGKFLTR